MDRFLIVNVTHSTLGKRLITEREEVVSRENLMLAARAELLEIPSDELLLREKGL